ncbi:VOC family protein [Hydrogenovibrio kuenenii]|uniref:VOC family protein n=1 Tax=Hydrogenovibrio kuenenii TaxID=63658 RepID=UPI0004AD0CFB|nr:VOC family protein [Hydrogenovibrio kuenenii]
MAIQIQQLDHLVLTVSNLEASLAFYRDILGFEAVEFAKGRFALHFGNQKINLHQTSDNILPRAKLPTPGSADLCFLSQTPMQQIIDTLAANQVKIIEGPIERTGAQGKILSVYIHDPDDNLIEIAQSFTKTNNFS